MEPTKLLGYRDSYLFFHKHPSLKRVRINDEEKATLKGMGLLHQWSKHRDVAVVTARSVFKCFGSKMVKRGRRIRDDYYENDHPEESPSKHTVPEEEEYDSSRKSLIAKTARSEGYSSKAPLTNQTWMHHAALAARGFNAQLHERRAAKPTFYDIHSNINQVSASYQSNSCKFEFTKDNNSNSTTPLVEFKSLTTPTMSAPLYRGVGKALLEYDIDAVVEAFPNVEEREQLRKILTNDHQVKEPSQEDDDSYPLAIMEGQFQANFPVHQARFNYPTPKVPDPTDMVDTAQSLAAQQFYLGLVYQSVNQYADLSRQSPMGRSPQNYSPAPPPQPQIQQQHTQHTPPQQQKLSTQPVPQVMQQPQQPSRMPINALAPEPPMCRTVLSSNQICRNPVNKAGEKCPAHQPPKQMSDFAKGPPPQMVYSDNKCTDCHQLKAAESLFNSPEEHVTDDFTVVKCSKCTRKYHPICANLTTPLQVAAVESYPWSCPECKICCVCKSAGDESTLMICDGCDRGWHTGCCNPKVENVPEGSWLCPLCANCHSCEEHGMEEESQYTHAIAPKTDRYKYPVYLATYCPKCNGNFKDDRFCTVCLKTYSEEEENDDEDNEMVACDTCDHWIHTRCDQQLTPEKYQTLVDDEEAKYTCPMCEDRFKRLVDTSTADLALKGLSAPSGFAVGLLGGKVKTRGIVKFKGIKIGVPEINGTGIAEMPSNK
ncbi:chromatin remodelling complex Rsc7/Swp82 subunit-domain-containing protein [Parasitella parasitica]|nr:chromatin remodelling complex Rsc7/Swp82 subunit-domain-containing protein [Parasitella parasitica]